MVGSAIFMGSYPASIDGKNRTYVPVRFRRNLEKIMGENYYLLISKKTDDGLNYLVLEPMSEEEASERKKLSGKVKAEVEKWGRVNLTASCVNFLDPQKEDNLYFVGCGQYCEFHKSKKDKKEFFDEISGAPQLD